MYMWSSFTMHITNNLLLPWEPMLILKYLGNQNYCGPIWGLLWGEPMTNSHSFIVRYSFKVCISNFPWQPIRIFKFWFCHYTFCLLQIDRAKFHWNRFRNGRGDSHNVWIGAFSCKIRVFFITMATVRKFPNSDKFSAVPVPSPSNWAVNEVSRSNGHSGRMFPTSEFY